MGVLEEIVSYAGGALSLASTAGAAWAVRLTQRISVAEAAALEALNAAKAVGERMTANAGAWRLDFEGHRQQVVNDFDRLAKELRRQSRPRLDQPRRQQDSSPDSSSRIRVDLAQLEMLRRDLEALEAQRKEDLAQRRSELDVLTRRVEALESRVVQQGAKLEGDIVRERGQRHALQEHIRFREKEEAEQWTTVQRTLAELETHLEHILKSH